ncbi:MULTISPECIES: GNAT family N-acetyltransferase [unclassified Brevundimonas]|uniref:GNAT family N-acetyltransferase n=1 Tax=unclassified Brevundimonas TaxID=2622653 RepID=UPI0025BD3226|nr:MULTISPECIES: GNAT family N-acetyltransferase [unclassified Brevundimonas]
MIEDYQLTAATPSIEDYLRLRINAGLSAKAEANAVAGLPNTWFAVVARRDGQVVGMGRIIGDGGLFFQIVDMAIEPAHQGRGLGKAIMTALMDRLRSHAQGAYVSLIADGEANRLYAQYGFEPTMPKSIGIAQVIR